MLRHYCRWRSVGLTAFDGTTDIAIFKRFENRGKLKFSEMKKRLNKLLSHDALTVIVNPANSVSKLTREQLKIFTEKLKLKEVGGADAKIVAYSRESSSGTYEFF
jgi:phosphate transport system substrate-binding protein